MHIKEVSVSHKAFFSDVKDGYVGLFEFISGAEQFDKSCLEKLVFEEVDVEGRGVGSFVISASELSIAGFFGRDEFVFERFGIEVGSDFLFDLEAIEEECCFISGQWKFKAECVFVIQDSELFCLEEVVLPSRVPVFVESFSLGKSDKHCDEFRFF